MCGLTGIIGIANASAYAVEGMYAQQPRGTEAAGVSSTDGRGVYLQGGLGLVGNVFPSERDVPKELPGTLAIAHNRYSTSTKTDAYQPIRGEYGREQFCLAHNGNLTNKAELAAFLGRDDVDTCVDSELIVRLIERMRTNSFERDLHTVLKMLRGSYCLLILFRDRLYAVRDPQGCRPLIIGTDESMTVVASETTAFDILNVEPFAQVDAGTFVCVTADRAFKITRFAPESLKRCAFEPVYFSHHTGDAFGIPLLSFRIELGIALEEECPVEADIVLGMPDSATVIAIGYGRSGRSGVFLPALARHHYAGGRTFILPTQEERMVAVRRKIQRARSSIRGNRLVLVDDSIVRGTTTRVIVKTLYDAGAAAVHVRIGYPPKRHGCLYGEDTSDEHYLVSAHMSNEEICRYIRADSLAFISQRTYLRTLGGDPSSWCMACTDGRYWHEQQAA